MQLVIIAGGKGTRLGLDDIPKPMIRIDNRPILEHQISLASSYGIKEIFILSGHLSKVIVDYFEDGRNFGVNITHIVEHEPLGTAGSLNLLQSIIKERFLVFYGDVFANFDIQSFIDFDKKKHSIATLLVHPNDHPKDSDLIDIDKNSQIVSFVTKHRDDTKFYRNLVNAAIYIFSPKIFDYLESNKAQDLGNDIFPHLVKKEIVMAYSTPEYIKDIGTKDRFHRVCNDFSNGKPSRLNKKNKRRAIFLDRDGVINKDMGDKISLNNFELLDDAAESIGMINKSQYLAIVVTNQPVIAKGFIAEDELHEIHRKMETILGRKNCYLDNIYYCPHHQESGFDGEIKELKIECNCRKPKPGMLQKAAEDFNIDLQNSFIIGDNIRDLIAGKAAGCKAILVNNLITNDNCDYHFDNLLNATQFILSLK